MVLSSEGLRLLSNVASWRHDFEMINDKNVVQCCQCQSYKVVDIQLIQSRRKQHKSHIVRLH